MGQGCGWVAGWRLRAHSSWAVRPLIVCRSGAPPVKVRHRPRGGDMLIASLTKADGDTTDILPTDWVLDPRCAPNRRLDPLHRSCPYRRGDSRANLVGCSVRCIRCLLACRLLVDSQPSLRLKTHVRRIDVPTCGWSTAIRGTEIASRPFSAAVVRRLRRGPICGRVAGWR